MEASKRVSRAQQAEYQAYEKDDTDEKQADSLPEFQTSSGIGSAR